MLPGVEKVGPKTAAKWLTEYGSLAEVLAHKVIVMKEGDVVEAGDSAAIFANPRTSYTRALMTAAFGAPA